MNSLHPHFYNHHRSEAVSFRIGQQNPIYQSTLHAPDNAFPVLAVAILGIAVTAILLLMYCIFVMKCCLNWPQRVDLLSQFSSQARRSEDPLMDYSPVLMRAHGLNGMLFREIPTFQFRRRGGEDGRNFFGCMVCLNEFQEQETLRLLPSCSHAFHLDCIDMWLRGSANCPICRSSISGATPLRILQTIAPTSSPQNSQLYADGLMGSDEDFVVIELGGEGGEYLRPHRLQERDDSKESPLVQCCSTSRGESSENNNLGKMKGRRFKNVSSKGDECIDIRERDDQFLIQPIRRSFSLGSTADRQLYLSVQGIVQHDKFLTETQNAEECNNGVQKSCFSFRHGRGSRNAVCPV